MTSTGRPQKEKTERITQEAIDAVLSLWVDRNEKLRFAEIHRALVNKGIVQNEKYHYKTVRILKRLVDDGIMEKHARGKYSLKTAPEQYQLFEQLAIIRKSEEMASIKIGGTFWTQAELHMLGFPEHSLNYGYVKAGLEILGIRIAEIFSALKELASIAQTKGKRGYMPSDVLRELVMEVPAYYLGSRAGIDGDGLAVDELKNVYGKMLLALPQQASDGTDWASNTLKEHILETFHTITSLPTLDEENLRLGNKTKPKNFALIVTEAEWNVDEKGYEQREIVSTIKYSMERGDNPFEIAHRLLIYDQESVSFVFHTRGLHYLGAKLQEVEKYYRQMLASREIAYDFRPIISNLYGEKEYHVGKERGYSHFIKQHMRKLREKAEKFVEQYGAKTLVSELPLYNTFGGPTPQKEEAVRLALPQYSTELIHEWLLEGDARARRMAHKALKDMKDALDTASRRH
jgi:hypothetical protein